eukprot:3433972-Rhodomonas_salina.2
MISLFRVTRLTISPPSVASSQPQAETRSGFRTVMAWLQPPHSRARDLTHVHVPSSPRVAARLPPAPAAP